MANFLEEILNIGKETIQHTDDILFGAGTEVYNKMVLDTQGRHQKFSKWGNETLNDLSARKKNLQEEETNYHKIINKLKSRYEALDIDIGTQTIDEYLAPLSGQLGTGLFLGEEAIMLPKITQFLKQTGGIQKGDPYVPSATYFQDNYGKLDTQMQDISGMGYNTWRALTKKGELSMIEDVKPVEFTAKDKVLAANDLSLTMKTFDLYYPANTPQAETYAMLSKYLLIKQEAMDKAQTEAGPDGDSQTLLLRARHYENQMVADANIDFERIGTQFGVDGNTIKTISTQGNPWIARAASAADNYASVMDPQQKLELEAQAIDYMDRATRFAINTSKSISEAAAGKGEYDVSMVQKKTVNVLRNTMGDKTSETIKHMVNVLDDQPSEAKAHSITDNSGQTKVDYAYLRMVGEGKRRWFIVDSNGVEIRTNLFESEDLGETTDKATVYAAIHNDIAKQMATGSVDYTNRAWVESVADQLGYEIDYETGLVTAVRGNSIKNSDGSIQVNGALYHGFRKHPIGISVAKEDIIGPTDVRGQ